MRIVLAAEDAEARNQVRQVILNNGHECGAEDSVNLDHLTFRVAQKPPDLVLVLVGKNRDAALDAIQKTSQQTALPILAGGPSDDAQVIMQAVRGGALEYLDQTNIRAELPAALEKIGRRGSIPKPRQGKTLAITSANVGSGVTTVATNLAFVLAENKPGGVVLAELGTGVPELALDLDLEPRHTVDQMMRDWERADATIIRRAAVEHSAGIHVLAYKPSALVSETFDPRAIRQILVLLRSLYDRTVIDLGHSAPPDALEAMKIADAVIVVTRLDVPSLRLCREYVKFLQHHDIPEEKIWRVANRFGQRRQLHWKQMEEALGLPFHIWIPDDPGSLNAALNTGQPLIQTAKYSRLIRRFRELAKQLNGKLA